MAKLRYVVSRLLLSLTIGIGASIVSGLITQDSWLRLILALSLVVMAAGLFAWWENRRDS